MTRPEVSIVLPTRNAGPRLGEVLTAIRTQDSARPLEIVAFDSSSSDGTVALLRHHGARITEIPASEFNHGETRNQAIASSRGRFIILLTQDAVPANRDWLEALLAPFADEQVAGSYARQIALPDADALTRRNLQRWVTGSTEARIQRLPDRATYLRLHPLERYKLCCFDDVCSAIRRTAWERIPYERTYFAEDLDWGKKNLEAGWSLAYEPRAAVIHSHDRSVWYEYKRTYLCHRRLFELFGLRTVPTFSDVVRNTWRGGLADAAFAWREQPGLRRRLGLAGRAPLLALLSNLAQWRGASDEHYHRPLPALRGV